MQSAIKSYLSQLKGHIYGKRLEISRPHEEFRICFCGKTSSESVEWYLIDVSVEEACLSEKTESSTKKLTPISVAKHFPSVYYAALGGRIYSLGGQRRSEVGGETLLKDVLFLDFKSLDGFSAHDDNWKFVLMENLDEDDGFDMAHRGEDWKSGSDKALKVEDWKPGSDKALKGEDWKTGSIYAPSFTGEEWKPVSGKALTGEDWNSGWNSGSVSAFIPLPGVDWKPPSGKEVSLISFEPPSSGNWKPPSSGKELRVVDWKTGPPMNFARCNPHTMVVDHKLYVLGGFLPNHKQADGWIEVFDPEEEKWEPLLSPPDQIHSSVLISGLLNAKKEIIIAKQRWGRHPILFYSYNITTRCWNPLVQSKASVCLPPNIGRAVTVGNTLYWISTEEHNHECIIRSYDLDRNMWFEDCLNTATIFGRREHFSSIYSSGPGFLHLRDQKFCLLLQSTVTKNDPQSPSIQYLYCVILEVSPIYEHEDRGKFELTTVSVQKYSMDHYINFLDCMLV